MGLKNEVSKNEISLLAFGGLGEIGMNLCAYKYKNKEGVNKYLVVDMGIGFDLTLPAQNKIVVPDVDFLHKHQKDIVGIVITHGHDDHIAAIPVLWHKIKAPIYVTPFPAALINKKTDNSDIRANIRIVSQGQWIDIEPFKIKFIGITHSIPESSAVAINACGNIVLHTGDWKFDPSPVIGNVTDEKSLREIGDMGVLALVCDSTNILENGGPAEGRSEASVVKDLENLVVQGKGKRVFISCISTNLARMKTCVDIAKRNGRRLCLVGRSMLKVHEAAESTGYWKVEDSVLIDSEGAESPRGSVLYLCTGSQGETGSSIEKIASGKHNCIKSDPGDVMIFSARTITGNEKAVNSIVNNFALKKVKVYFPDANHHIHVSGHPYREDVSKMYEIIRPKLVIPVHGEARHLVSHCEFAQQHKLKSWYIESGEEIALSPSGATKIGQFHSGKDLVEGNALLSTTGSAIKERMKLQTGIVMIFISGKMVKVDTIGIQDNSEELNKDLVALTHHRMTKLLLTNSEQSLDPSHSDKKHLLYHQIITDMLKTVTNWFKDKQGRKPIVRVHLLGRYIPKI